MVGRVDVNKIVPTAPAGTSDNRVASTQFVQNALPVVPVAATKAQQQAGTSNSVFVTPLHQQDHDSAAKVWVDFTSAATPIVNASYNVSSVTKSGTGTFVVNFTTAFASANYVVVVTAEGSATQNGFGQVSNGGRAAGSVTIQFGTVTAGAIALFDPATCNVACFGRQ